MLEDVRRTYSGRKGTYGDVRGRTRTYEGCMEDVPGRTRTCGRTYGGRTEDVRGRGAFMEESLSRICCMIKRLLEVGRTEDVRGRGAFIEDVRERANDSWSTGTYGDGKIRGRTGT